MNSIANRWAKDILGMLKYNPDLSESDKELAIECRLVKLINDIERACAEANQRSQNNTVVVDSRPQDIPELKKLLLSSQQHRGPMN